MNAGTSYNLTLNNAILDATISAGATRPTPTKRWLADLVITSASVVNPALKSSAIVPIMVELDSSNKLYSCTVRPDTIDDVLSTKAGLGGAHSARDCLKAGGTPYPTTAGLVCRIPVGEANKPVNISVSPPVLLCPAGWTKVTSPAGVPYTTTLVRDLHMTPKCSKQTYCDTSWHSMAAVPIGNEKCTAYRDSSGSGGASNQTLGATIIALGTVFSSFNLPVVGFLAGTGFGGALVSLGTFIVSNPIGWVIGVVIVLDLIFGGGSGGGCSDVGSTQYPQYIGVACW